MYLREIKFDGHKDADFSKYPFNLSLFKKGHFEMKFASAVTFLVGENGSGKSTLLEAIAIACGFHPSGGSRNNVYDTVQTESRLADYLRLIWNFKINSGFFLRSETFYNFASELDELRKNPYGGPAYEPYGGKSLHQQSHGESFLALFQNRLNKGLFIFDEPEAALSPQRQLHFLSILDERAKSGNCQFIIATHSPIIMSYPHATFYEIKDGEFKESHYSQSEHFKISKDFLTSPESFHKHLFG